MRLRDTEDEAFVGLVLVTLTFLTTNVLFAWAAPKAVAVFQGMGGVDEFVRAAAWLGSIALVQMLLAVRYSVRWATIHGGLMFALATAYACTFTAFAMP